MTKKTWVGLRNEAKNYVDRLVDQYVPSDPGNSALKGAIGRYGYLAMRHGERQESLRIMRILKNFPIGEGPDYD